MRKLGFLISFLPPSFSTQRIISWSTSAFTTDLSCLSCWSLLLLQHITSYLPGRCCKSHQILPRIQRLSHITVKVLFMISRFSYCQRRKSSWRIASLFMTASALQQGAHTVLWSLVSINSDRSFGSISLYRALSATSHGTRGISQNSCLQEI